MWSCCPATRPGQFRRGPLSADDKCDCAGLIIIVKAKHARCSGIAGLLEQLTASRQPGALTVAPRRNLDVFEAERAFEVSDVIRNEGSVSLRTIGTERMLIGGNSVRWSMLAFGARTITTYSRSSAYTVRCGSARVRRWIRSRIVRPLPRRRDKPRQLSPGAEKPP